MKNKGFEWSIYRDNESLDVIIAFGETHLERRECACLLSDSGKVTLLAFAIDRDHAESLKAKYNLDAHLTRCMKSQGKYPFQFGMVEV